MRIRFGNPTGNLFGTNHVKRKCGNISLTPVRTILVLRTILALRTLLALRTFLGIDKNCGSEHVLVFMSASTMLWRRVQDNSTFDSTALVGCPLSQIRLATLSPKHARPHPMCHWTLATDQPENWLELQVLYPGQPKRTQIFVRPNVGRECGSWV